MIRYFDSLTHPTVSGTWFKNEDSSFSTLLDEVENNPNIYKVCAVNNPIFGCQKSEFLKKCKLSEKLFPVARLSNEGMLSSELAEAIDLGFSAIKIHPRQLATPNLEIFDEVFRTCEECNIRVFLCTYYFAPNGLYPEVDYLYQIGQILKKFPNLRLLLVHGGGVRLREFMEFVRHHPTTLLDLSLTMLKYEGSSIDLDVKFLITNFDRRICIGSDHPEFPISAPLEYLMRFRHELSHTKFENIAWKNLASFLGI